MNNELEIKINELVKKIEEMPTRSWLLTEGDLKKEHNGVELVIDDNGQLWIDECYIEMEHAPKQSLKAYYNKTLKDFEENAMLAAVNMALGSLK